MATFYNPGAIKVKQDGRMVDFGAVIVDANNEIARMEEVINSIPDDYMALNAKVNEAVVPLPEATNNTRLAYDPDGETIEIPSMDDVNRLSESIAEISDAIFIKKNLVTEKKDGFIRSNNGGKVSAPWANTGYSCAIAEVSGLEKVTLNYDWAGSSFAFFADENDNVIGTKAQDYRDTSKGGFVYTVPSNAKRLYFSANVSSYATQYNTRGFVVFDGDFNINDDKFTTSKFGYGGYGAVVYADLLSMRNSKDLGTYLYDMEQRISNKNAVFYCKKDGTGNFVKISDALNYVYSNNLFDATIHVCEGVWDIISELGSDYVESAGSSKRGLYLKNRVHLVCDSKALITCKYTGTRPETIEWLSAFNMGEHGGTIENAHIESDNVRYTIHDEYGYEAPTPYVNKYINCHMKHTNGKYVNCIGGGLGIDGRVEIRGCYFEGNNLTSGNNRLAYYHGNNERGKTSAKATIEVHDNYFAGLGSFGVTVYGDSTEVSKALVSNNSVGSAITKNNGSYAPNDNIELISWNNEIR